MEELDVRFRLHHEVRLLFAPFSEERNVTIKDIDLIALFCYQLGAVEDAASTYHRTAYDGQHHGSECEPCFLF